MSSVSTKKFTSGRVFL